MLSEEVSAAAGCWGQKFCCYAAILNQKGSPSASVVSAAAAAVDGDA